MVPVLLIGQHVAERFEDVAEEIEILELRRPLRVEQLVGPVGHVNDGVDHEKHAGGFDQRLAVFDDREVREMIERLRRTLARGHGVGGDRGRWNEQRPSIVHVYRTLEKKSRALLDLPERRERDFISESSRGTRHAVIALPTRAT